METKNTVDEKEIIESLNRTMQYGNRKLIQGKMHKRTRLNRTMQYGNEGKSEHSNSFRKRLNRTMQYGNFEPISVLNAR